MLFEIDGYFKDDKSEFSGLVVSEFCDAQDDDIDVFFYGMDEKQIKQAIKAGEDTVHDFVITSYQKL